MNSNKPTKRQPPRNRKKGPPRPAQKPARPQETPDPLTREQRELLVRRAKARADLYEIFSLLFQEVPSADFLAVFRHSDFLSILELLLTPEILAKWKKFASSKVPLDQLQNRLRLEYNNLFLLPTSQQITLRESIFFFQKGKPDAPQKRIDSLLRFYRRIGLTPMAKFKDQPDHFSQIMHFMSVLCEREKDYGAKRNTAQLETICQIQAEFLTKHLEVWVPLFWERMYQSTRFIFYRDIADTLKDLLQSEMEWIPGLPEKYSIKKISRSPSDQEKSRSDRKSEGQRPRPRKYPKKKKGGGESERKPSPPKTEGEGQHPKRRRRRRRPRKSPDSPQQSNPS